MVNIPTWKRILILCVCIFGLLYSLPNVLPSGMTQSMQTNLPGWLPGKTINLGLDLQGGAHLVMEADITKLMSERSDNLQDMARSTFRENDIRTRGRILEKENGIRLTLEDPSQRQQAEKLLRNIDEGLEVLSAQSGTIEAHYTETTLEEIKNQALNQSIEIIRRRIDETGTKEPAIQRQGDNRILVQLPGVEDPQRIKNLIGTTAKLTFHLVAHSGTSGTTKSYPMVEDPAIRLTVKRTPDVKGDMLVSASTGFDMNNQPVVNFRLNNIGAERFCKVSSENVGKQFAIVLDNQIISAPVFRDAICGGQAQISGNFTVATSNDLALLLRAGALPVELKFVEERTVGPSLGADSVEAGKMASLIGLALVLGFMLFIYRLFGLFASLALVVNVTLIFALLSLLQATLTLPGIAGIVLTIGMAVDANVLIFERIKEEIINGRSPLAAIEAGYSRAFSTIIDSNLTTLIAATILYSFGTGPIKGFAVTLAIGILTSLFTAIMVTRLLVIIWYKMKRPATLPL